MADARSEDDAPEPPHHGGPDDIGDSDDTYELAEPAPKPSHQPPPLPPGRAPTPPGPPAPTSFRCARCGYDLSGTPLGGACPECGTPVTVSLHVGGPRRDTTSEAAVVCLVLGVLSIGCCGLLGPFAILYYFKAKKDIDAGTHSDSSALLATIGLVLGCISTALWVIAGFFQGIAMLL